MQPAGPDAEAAKQLIEAAKAQAPTGFISDRRREEEAKAAEKAAQDKAQKEKQQQKQQKR